MSIIVTGASGQLGRLVIDQLLATVPASEVTAVARDPAKTGDLAARGVTLAVADYNSPESFDGLLRAGDRVLLISGSEMHLDRVAQHKAVLGAAVKAGVALFAYTSAPAARPARSPTTTAPPRTPSAPPGSRTACCATTFTTRCPR